MTLVAFRVTNFRSVRDSGWIDAAEITALIGTNESGKTNLLLPLWKLNPAKEGEINLIADAPRKEYNAIRQAKNKPIFISARFALSKELTEEVATVAGVTAEEVAQVEVSRDLGGRTFVSFPNAKSSPTVPKSEVANLIEAAQKEIQGLRAADEADETRKAAIIAAIDSLINAMLKMPDGLKSTELAHVTGAMDPALAKDSGSASMVSARYNQLVAALVKSAKKSGKPGANESEPAKKLIVKNLPVFVYYTTYGNLDSEIYLPHVIEDLKRTDLSGKSEARARTLRVLFEFVRLQPSEILELGKDWNEKNGKPTEDQIQELNERKKERSVLMQSASTELTKEFRDWWKQGEYRIRFEADGNHFRIWVSDDMRPEEIELEGRSTGLQWFLSFYLIFLVESKAAHNGAILLLDEPGHSLHPLAQKELSKFFDHLGQSNQILYTTHSPFLIDADHLDRARNVFVGADGHTVASPDLRAGPVAAQSKSVYAAHAALGLSLCDSLLQGCRPVVVEGQSDQLYLSAIKNSLIAAGRFKPMREVVFVPTSGAKAIKVSAAILGGRDDDLPIVLCDGDEAGVTLANALKKDMYSTFADRVLLMSDFNGTQGGEVEDLFPKSFLVPIVDRYLKGPDDQPFTAPDMAAPIVPQIKEYAAKHGIVLRDGWKVEIASLVKARLEKAISLGDDWKQSLDTWERLFARLSERTASEVELKSVSVANGKVLA